ncbi:hypothetical protein CAOG_01161 [Capsaspora owczarzaki ATCC 30864]|uniref:PIN domain-containing protein n=1 Tax=Capsaspora owczarzaki (strain ATCC 30864) TaxID=595528 RepID=A0A0D2WIN5_CAPO3|nr:hypothetical protein CAOG_01161 [Capsaspora owczarzaki ATCC 30864]KJE89730.1 hypothetical protein CAOG_001161 [Capsaspora owczarzaki ATCC 30864]|eukprot:XP_004366032.2 hypothetical protein CAOG_01161 [Capsaspora owczarzaki ATCC 30864]
MSGLDDRPSSSSSSSSSSGNTHIHNAGIVRQHPPQIGSWQAKHCESDSTQTMMTTELSYSRPTAYQATTSRTLAMDADATSGSAVAEWSHADHQGGFNQNNAAATDWWQGSLRPSSSYNQSDDNRVMYQAQFGAIYHPVASAGPLEMHQNFQSDDADSAVSHAYTNPHQLTSMHEGNIYDAMYADDGSGGGGMSTQSLQHPSTDTSMLDAHLSAPASSIYDHVYVSDSSAAAMVTPLSLERIFVVVDTNVLISDLPFLRLLLASNDVAPQLEYARQAVAHYTSTGCAAPGAVRQALHQLEQYESIRASELQHHAEKRTLSLPQRTALVVVLPWTVVQELDRLKKGNVSTEAQRANEFLLRMLQAKHPFLKGQPLKESSKGFNEPGIENNDDRILDCCLRYRQSKVPMPRVILLTNDKNLGVKALVNNIECFSVADFPQQLEPMSALHGEFDGGQPFSGESAGQSHLDAVLQMDDSELLPAAAAPPFLPHGFGSSTSLAPRLPTARQPVALVMDESHTPSPVHLGSDNSPTPYYGAVFDSLVVEFEKHMSVAVMNEVRAELGELWSAVVKIQPPWNTSEMMTLIKQTWSAFSFLPREIEDGAAKLIPLLAQQILKTPPRSMRPSEAIIAISAFVQIVQNWPISSERRPRELADIPLEKQQLADEGIHTARDIFLEMFHGFVSLQTPPAAAEKRKAASARALDHSASVDRVQGPMATSSSLSSSFVSSSSSSATSQGDLVATAQAQLRPVMPPANLLRPPRFIAAVGYILNHYANRIQDLKQWSPTDVAQVTELTNRWTEAYLALESFIAFAHSEAAVESASASSPELQWYVDCLYSTFEPICLLFGGWPTVPRSPYTDWMLLITDSDQLERAIAAYQTWQVQLTSLQEQLH